MGANDRLDDGLRDEDHPRGLRVETLDVLQVEAHHEGRHEDGAVVHQGGQARKGEGLVLEEPDIEERRFGPGLEPHESRHDGDPQEEQHRPRQAGEQGEAVHDQDQGDAVEDGPLEVEGFPLACRPFAAELPVDDQENGEPDGNCTPEQAPPAQVMGHGAAQNRCEGKGGIGGGDDDADGLSPLLGREQGGHDGQTRHEDDPPADPLKDPKEDQPVSRRSEGS